MREAKGRYDDRDRVPGRRIVDNVVELEQQQGSPLTLHMSGYQSFSLFSTNSSEGSEVHPLDGVIS